MTWYKSGVVNVTNGSTAVTGVGTAWVDDKIKPGYAFIAAGGSSYEISSVVSATSLILASPYSGATATNTTYSILPTYSALEDLADDVKDLVDRYGNLPDEVGLSLTQLENNIDTKLDTRMNKTLNLFDLDSPVQARMNLGLDKVENTSDLSKPVSTATQQELNKKLDKTDNSVGIAFPDTRAVIPLPTDLKEKSLTVDFKSRTSVGSPPTTATASSGYAHVLNIRGWSDSSGGHPSQVTFGDGMAVRKAISNTEWGPWREFWHTGNLTPADYLKVADNLSNIANAAIARANLGLDKVDNTSDANKPVSTAQQAALDLKANLESPVFTGKPTLAASVAGSASLNIPHGATPTTLVNGDFWTTTSGVFAHINGATRTLAHTASWSVPSQAEAEAGTGTTARLFTSQRVRQAIIAAPVGTETQAAIDAAKLEAQTALNASKVETQTALDLKRDIANTNFNVVTVTNDAANSIGLFHVASNGRRGIRNERDGQVYNLDVPDAGGILTTEEWVTGNCPRWEYNPTNDLGIKTRPRANFTYGLQAFVGGGSNITWHERPSALSVEMDARNANFTGIKWVRQGDQYAAAIGVVIADATATYLTISVKWSHNHFMFHNDGSATAPGTWNANSDIRVKTNITSLSNPLDILANWGAYKYLKNGNEEIGLIAQEVQETAPELVQVGQDTQLEDGTVIEKTLSLNYGGVGAVTVGAINALHELVKQQALQIAALESRISALEQLTS